MKNTSGENQEKPKKPLNKKQKFAYATAFVLLFVAVAWTVLLVADDQANQNKRVNIQIPDDMMGELDDETLQKIRDLKGSSGGGVP